MSTIAEQLLAAMRRRGWSVRRLLDESGLPCDRSSLQRKLHGAQPLDADEIQSLVNALEATVAAIPDESKAS